ncbi:alpha/beta hydrolase [Sphingorhabdus sp.]|uniref:alpha/beta hydrolase n=1 Tax=Sphingorhabdus sp. TaxID=1902408 RepID=UPI0035AEE2F1|nr:alpha/beta hydrolase [Sphingomonadaceae bacterium]
MSDHFVRPDVRAFLDFLNSQPGPKMHELSATEARAMMAEMGALAEEELGALAVVRDLSIPGPAGVIPARLYDAREGRGAGAVMVFYHGGGFVIGDLDIYGPYCAEVARQLDIPVISIDYRLAPEHRFPAAAVDCEAATRWIAGSPAELGLEVTGLVTSGDSAGGNLTIVTTMALRDNPAAVPVLLQHPIYPVVTDSDDWPSMRDFAEGYLLTRDSMDYFHAAYQTEGDDYRGAPIKFAQQGMPPSLVTTTSLDPLRDQGLAYVEALKAAGVTVQHRSADGNIHGHITLRRAIPSSKEDVAGNLSALKAMLAEVMADA